MAWKKLTSVSLLFIPIFSHAEDALDYLHRGAQDYIFAKEAEAKKEFVTGLQKFPDDRPLQQALSLIREQKQKPPQEGEQDQKDKQEQNKQEQKSSGNEKEKKDQQSQKQDGKPGEEKEEQNGSKSDEKPGGDREKADQKLSGEVKGNPSQAQEQKDEQAEAAAEELAAAEGKMTERQAKALLESLKSEDEKVRLVDPNERKRAVRGLRDW